MIVIIVYFVHECVCIQIQCMYVGYWTQDCPFISNAMVVLNGKAKCKHLVLRTGAVVVLESLLLFPKP